MSSQQLRITIIQPDIVWENKEANYLQYEKLLADDTEKKQVVLLPEMFNTGFSMKPEFFAETMDGEAMQWMRITAARHKCILTGSLMIKENGNYYNRLIWMLPNGQFYHYDKRHLFAYAGENEHYTAGDKRLIVSVNGWKICLMVCYDLRFPVWLRNQNEEYDLLIVVANWPERRAVAWRSLLMARAIENMSYVVGVNRVGTDGNDIQYSGGSAVFSPLGETLWEKQHAPAIHTLVLDKEKLVETRRQFPFLNDADKFMLL